LAYVFGRRKDEVFLKLKRLLEPFGITRYYTDGWGAYEHHLDPEQHRVGKDYTQKIETLLVNVPSPKIHALEASVIQGIYWLLSSFDCRLQGRILKRFRINQQSHITVYTFGNV
jgi:IS1 transposase